jgi:hypothetical protein
MLVSSVRVYKLNTASQLMQDAKDGVDQAAFTLSASPLRMDCQDTARFYMSDEHGKGCAFYTGRNSECGLYDNDAFKANNMCCACGGGLRTQPAFNTQAVADHGAASGVATVTDVEQQIGHELSRTYKFSDVPPNKKQLGSVLPLQLLQGSGPIPASTDLSNSFVKETLLGAIREKLT